MASVETVIDGQVYNVTPDAVEGFRPQENIYRINGFGIVTDGRFCQALNNQSARLLTVTAYRYGKKMIFSLVR
jgi:hypothetical protein